MRQPERSRCLAFRFEEMVQGRIPGRSEVSFEHGIGWEQGERDRYYRKGPKVSWNAAVLEAKLFSTEAHMIHLVRVQGAMRK